MSTERRRMRHEASAVWQDDPPAGELLPVFRCCICSDSTYSGGSFPTMERARNWALLTPDEGDAAGDPDVLRKWIDRGNIPESVLA